MADVLRILIVDEDPDSRVVVRRALQRAQLEIVGEAGFGAAAVSLALSARPDIIFLSVEEPITRPLETAEALANALPETPFIVYSSLNQPEAMRRAMVFGARDYILKPVQANRLVDAINTVLVQQERRQMRRAGHLFDPSGRGTVISIIGAKGGIGKTVISVNLGVALKVSAGRSVVIFDADTEFGDVATLLDLAPERTVADLLPNLDRVDRETIRGFVTSHPNVDVLAAPPDGEVWLRANPESIKRIVDLLTQNYDFVVVDTRGSLDPMVRAAVEVSTLILLVTSSEVSSIRDTVVALRRLEAWQIPEERIKVIFNSGSRSANGVYIQDLNEAFQREVFWEIPADPELPASVQVGRPVVLDGKSPGARNLIELAECVAGTRTPMTHQDQTRSPLARISRLFSLGRRSK